MQGGRIVTTVYLLLYPRVQHWGPEDVLERLGRVYWTDDLDEAQTEVGQGAIMMPLSVDVLGIACPEEPAQ